LVKAVAAQNNNTMVVIHSVGPLIVEPWINHPNVTAVVWAGLEGTETGNALVDVMYGAKNPSGRLPYTIAKKTSDYPAQLVEGGDGVEILNITYLADRHLFMLLAACSWTIVTLTRRTSSHVSNLVSGSVTQSSNTRA
jgi:hypothetical protein